MPAVYWYVIAAVAGAVLIVVMIGSPIARNNLRARFPQLFEPVAPNTIVFHRDHVRVTVQDAPRVPLRSRESTMSVTVTSDELILQPEGPALLFFADRFLLLRVPLSDVEVVGTHDNLSQTDIRVPTMDRSTRMHLWLLMNQYREFADAMVSGGASRPAA